MKYFVDRFFGSVVTKNDGDLSIQKSHFTITCDHSIEIETAVREDLRVRCEYCGRTGIILIAFSDDLEGRSSLSAFKFNMVNVSFTAYFYDHLGSKRINYGSTYTMQTAGNAICAAAELTTGMKYCVYDFNSRNTHFRVNTDRNTGTVILYCNRTIFIYCDLDGITAAGKRLIDRVRYDLIYEVVKASEGRITDIHTRTLSNGFQTLQDLNIFLVIFFLVRGVEIILSLCRLLEIFERIFLIVFGQSTRVRSEVYKTICLFLYLVIKLTLSFRLTLRSILSGCVLQVLFVVHFSSFLPYFSRKKPSLGKKLIF